MNIEKILDRLDMLYQYEENFPNGIMYAAVKNEIEHLEKLLNECE